LSIPVTSFSVETYNTVYVEGKAPISIDGELSDWSFVNVPSARIEWFDPKWGIPENDSDLSAAFTCFHDAYNLYVAVTVKDESFVTEQNVFGLSWYDDSVEIYIDGDINPISEEGFDNNDAKIRISADNDGKTMLEGLSQPSKIEFPYMWESLGVRAALKQNDDGYVVEVSIPYKVLGWEQWETGRQMGMNIRVIDDDDGGQNDGFIGWVSDPDYTYFVSTKSFNHVAFTIPVTISGIGQSGQVEISKDQPQEIIAVIESSDQDQNYDDIFAVLNQFGRQTFRGEYNTAMSILSAQNEKPWNLALLGLVQSTNNKYKECIQTYSQLIDKSQDKSVCLWAGLEVGRAYKNLGEDTKAEDEFDSLLFSLQDNWVAEFEFIQKLERAGAYRVVIKLLKNLINASEKEEILVNARLALARNYFYIGDYDNATQLAKELINQNVDSKITLDAQMILLSINKK